MSVEIYLSRLNELTERQAEQPKPHSVIGRIHLELAKLLISFSIEECKAAGVEEQYTSSVNHCKIARSHFGTDPCNAALRADSYGIQANANLFNSRASASLMLFEDALRELNALQMLTQEPAIDESWFTQRKRLWLKNRALALQYVGRLDESVDAYQTLFAEVDPNQDRAEFLHLVFLLVTAYSDTARTQEGFETLKLMQDKVSLDSDDERLRFHSARAELHFMQGDIANAMDDAHCALNIFLDNIEQLSDRANIVIRVARYHIQVGDFEKAKELVDAYQSLYPTASGVMLQVNQLCIDAYIGHHAHDTELFEVSLSKLHAILSAEPDNEVMSYWAVYFSLRAKAIIRQQGHWAALDYLLSNELVEHVIASALTRESFPIALTVLSCAVVADDEHASVRQLAQTLVNQVALCTSVDQWQVPLFIAKWYRRMDEEALAAQWVWLAIQTSRVQQLPLYGSVEQAHRTLRDRHEPWVLLEHIVARQGNLYAASEIRRRRHSAELEYRDSGEASFEELKAFAANVIQPELSLLESWKLLCLSQPSSDEHLELSTGVIDLPIRTASQVSNSPKDNSTVITSTLPISKNLCVLSYFSSSAAVWATLDVGERRFQVKLSISLTTIRESVFELLNAIEQRRDWLGPSQVLYEYILAPISHHLTESVSVFAHDVFGQIPFAALHNGETYLVTQHRFQIGLITQPTVLSLPKSEDIVFVGSSGYQSSWPVLNPQLEKCVFSVFNRSIQTLIDDAATPQSIQAALKLKPHIIHIFSHSRLDSGAIYDSQWLFPGGRAVSLADLVHRCDHWRGLPLLFLASCDTGYSVSQDANRNASIPEVFTALGVANVIAATGRLIDQDHTPFAHQFYSELYRSRDVGEALQRTQISLIDRPRSGWGTYMHWVAMST